MNFRTLNWYNENLVFGSSFALSTMYLTLSRKIDNYSGISRYFAQSSNERHGFRIIR